MTHSNTPSDAAGTPEPEGEAKSGRDYLLVSASSAIAVIATFASGVLLARLLSVEDRGLVALIVYWAGFAAAFGNLSLADALIYRDRDGRRPLRHRLPSAMLVVLSLASIVIGIAAVGLFAFSDRFAGIPLPFAAAVIGVFVAINHVNMALVAVERASLNFARLALEQTLLPVLYSGLLILAAFTDRLTVEAALVVFLVSRAPILLVRLWRYRRDFIGAVELKEMSGLIATGARFHAVALLKTLADQADKVVVSIQWTATNIAYFAVGYSAAGAAYSLVSQALNLISLPVASKLSSDRIVDHFARSLRITTILLCAAMIPLVLVAPVIIPFIFGADYLAAVLVTQVLAIALLPSPLVAQADAVLRARGQIRAAMRLHLITLAVLVLGWAATGYDDIVELGGALAVARIFALGLTIATLRGELASLRLADCVLWRKSDFAIILGTARDVATQLTKRKAG